MFDFAEYCEICDEIASKNPNAKENDIRFGKCLSVDSGILLALCMAANDIQDDEAYFELLVSQSNLETLYKILPYFADGSRIDKIINQRIQLLQNCEENILESQVNCSGNKEKTFFEYLCEWIDKKGYKSDSEFYNSAGISRQVFSKIRNNKGSITREMAIHLAVSLELNYVECTEFLSYLGYSLNPNSRREQIISYMMKKRKYTFYEMEELLSAFHEKTFLNWD